MNNNHQKMKIVNQIVMGNGSVEC